MSMFEQLASPFSPDIIHWRAQSVSTKKPDEPKAMALAYVDARDVMNRLDAVCGPGGWQDSYVETPQGRIICTLSIEVDGRWIAKSDGAGKTDIEGDKGGLSDAFKRAAVKWGIGRHLYDMPTPWVRCELYNGKWSSWTQQGLAELKRVASRQASPPPADQPALTDADQDIAEIAALAQAAGVAVGAICDTYKVENLNQLTAEQRTAAKKRLNLTIDQNTARKEAA